MVRSAGRNWPLGTTGRSSSSHDWRDLTRGPNEGPAPIPVMPNPLPTALRICATETPGERMDAWIELPITPHLLQYGNIFANTFNLNKIGARAFTQFVVGMFANSTHAQPMSLNSKPNLIT